MAYTGTAPMQYATICEQQLSPGVQVGPNCAIVGFDTAVVFPLETGVVIPDAQELSDLFTVIIYLVAMVFVIAMIKKAIEQ